MSLDLRPLDPDMPDERPMIVAEPPAYALHRWADSGFVSLFGTARVDLIVQRATTNAHLVCRFVAAAH